MPSDSEKYLHLTSFLSLCVRHKIDMLVTQNLNGISHLNVRRAQNLDGISHLVVLGTFKVCLELSSNSKAQFGLVMAKFSELEHTSK